MRRRVVLVTTDSRVHRRVADHLSGKDFVVQALEAPDTGPDELPEAGDLDGAAAWKRILRAVEELQGTKPESGARVN